MADAPAPATGPAAPPDVTKRIRRARRHVKNDAAKRRLCQLFLKGESYSFINHAGSLNFQEINPGARSGKPAHRIRNRYNFIKPLVMAKVSTVTTRPPGYEVNPTGTDPEVVGAAQLAEKLAAMGYRAWYVDKARVQGATLAVGGGGRAYALPYFDPMVGPFVQQDDGSLVGEGEIKVMIFSGNECGWEPGVEFHHSRWYYCETAQPISEVEKWPGYLGGALTADASTGDNPSDLPTEDMVLVTYFFERPCPEYPDGRWLTLANNRQIVPEDIYPLVHEGQVIDKPVLHELQYSMDVDGESDLGLTWELIDFQRTISDCYNKALELKNRGLNLRILAPEGSLLKPPTDEPGGITYFRPIGGFRPEFEKAPDTGILNQLNAIMSRAVEDMRWVAADADLAAAPNVAANALQAVSQQAASRWSQFVDNFARWDADVMSHCLLIAQNRYTEQRTLKVRGRYGWEPVSSFKGADIMGQVDVTVRPNTIESQSRQAILQQLGWIQANFPGYLRPEVAIDIVMTGTSPESIIESFEFDKARANLIIQHIRSGTVMDMPKVPLDVPGPPDPLTGQPTTQSMIAPGWMPRPFDNVDVQLWVLETWMKTDDFSRQPPAMMTVAMTIYQGMKQLQAQQAAQAAAAQNAQAMALGATNAAKPQPQEAKPMPSTPNPAGEAPA